MLSNTQRQNFMTNTNQTTRKPTTTTPRKRLQPPVVGRVVSSENNNNCFIPSLPPPSTLHYQEEQQPFAQGPPQLFPPVVVPPPPPCTDINPNTVRMEHQQRRDSNYNNSHPVDHKFFSNGTIADKYQYVHHIIQNIPQVISREQRNQILHMALQVFSSDDPHLNNYGMDLGADKVICLQLGYFDVFDPSSSSSSSSSLSSSSSSTAMMTPPCNNSSSELSSHLKQQWQQQQQAEFFEDYALFCSCLLSLYHCCSRDRRLRSFEEIGQTDMIPLLLKRLQKSLRQLLLNDENNNNNNTHSSNNYNKKDNSWEKQIPMIVSIIQLLRVFSKLDAAHVKSHLIHRDKGQILSIVAYFFKHYHPSLLSSSTMSPSISGHDYAVIQLQLELLGMIRDLTFRAVKEDKDYIYHRLGTNLVQHYHHHASTILMTNNNINNTKPKTDSSSIIKMLEIIADLFWNFATLPKICEQIAIEETVLQMLGHMLQLEKDESVIKIKRNALSAMGNVVATLTSPSSTEGTKETKPSCRSDNSDEVMEVDCVNDENEEQESNTTAQNVIFHKQDWFLPTLIRLIKEESDNDIQRRSVRTLRCLSSCTWGRKLLCSHPGFVSSLTHVLKNRNNNNVDCDIDTRIHACQTIGYLTGEPRNMKRIGPVLETMLLQTIENNEVEGSDIDDNYKLTISACKALSLCMNTSPWKRSSSLFSTKFFDQILEACRQNNLKNQNAETVIANNAALAKLLKQLVTPQRMTTASASISSDLSFSSSSSMDGCCCTTPVIETITELLSSPCMTANNGGTNVPELEQLRSDIMDVLILFVKDDANKRRLAENDGLLTTLVNFALTCPQDHPQKDSAKQMILDLVPEL